MSARYVMSALVFYPICPGRPVYAGGSSVFDRAVIRLPGDGAFVVTAWNNAPENRYVQSLTLNGAPHDKPWFEHAALRDGGSLHFVMGPKPNKTWGSAPADAPPACLRRSE